MTASLLGGGDPDVRTRVYTSYRGVFLVAVLRCKMQHLARRETVWLFVRCSADASTIHYLNMYFFPFSSSSFSSFSSITFAHLPISCFHQKQRCVARLHQAGPNPLSWLVCLKTNKNTYITHQHLVISKTPDGACRLPCNGGCSTVTSDAICQKQKFTESILTLALLFLSPPTSCI